MRKIIFVIMVIILSSVMIVTSYGAADIPAGDVNGDGRVTAADARLTLRAAASLDLLADTAFVAADVNQDGKITAADARTILRIAAGLDKTEDESIPPDFKRFEDAMMNSFCVEFDYMTADTGYIVDYIIHDTFFVWTYEFYFGPGSAMSVENAYSDPRGELFFHYKLPVENVKWICEEIYQVKFDENYSSAEGLSYYHDGYVYVENGPAGYGCDFMVSTNDYNLIDDGKYEITASYYMVPYDFGYGDIQPEFKFNVKVIAEWKLVDGKYDWVFFSVEQVDSPDFERMRSILNATYFAEFDCETADADYVIDNIIFAGRVMPTYKYYFTYDTDYIQNSGWEKIDPLGMFESDYYFRVPVENIKWICENIYQVEFDEDDFSGGERVSYCYGGDYYRVFNDVTRREPYSYTTTINSYTLLDDGKYEISANYFIFDCVNESVVQDQTYKIIAEWMQIDGKYDWVFYSVEHIDSPDFDRMADLLTNMFGNTFDYKTADTAYVVDYIIHSDLFIPTYEAYFNEDTYISYGEGNKISDPLNKLSSGAGYPYYKIPAENIKWICENIYQIEFDANYISNTGESYCYGDYVYIECPQTGYGPFEFKTEIIEYRILDNGRYEINAYYYTSEDFGSSFELECRLKVIAEWKQIDGKYDWVFYNVDRI